MFYGWYIVGAALLLQTYSAGVFLYGFTAFINPIRATFGWSYAQITLAMSLRGLEVGILDPFLGAAADRWPSRRLMLIGVSLCGLGVFCISQATNLAMFYMGFLIMGLGSSFALFMVPQVTVARWFKRDIGKATGAMVVGRGIGGALLPALVIMIDTYSWQTSLVILAVGIMIVGIPLSFIFRTRPEEYGLLPDGKPHVNGPSTPESYDFSIGVKEALKMRAFWHISMGTMLQMGPMMAAITYVMPYLTSLGIERSDAGTIAMLISLISLGGRIPAGWFSDIFSKKYVIATSILLTAIGLFIFSLMDGSSFGLMIVFAVIFGLSVGSAAPIKAALVREYFGTRKFGTIYGLLGAASAVGMVLCPPLAGWVFDTLGVYDPIWLVFSGVSMIGVIIMLTTPPASRKLKPNMD